MLRQFMAILLCVAMMGCAQSLAGARVQPATNVVFASAADASKKYRVLHNFGKDSDGASPWAGLVEVNHTLYGTTFGGGKYGYGTVYSITNSGNDRVLYNCQSYDRTVAGLINVKRTLYGTTYTGGAYGRGAVFSVSSTGSNYRVLYSFHRRPDGALPIASLIEVNGALYGTTVNGGVYNGGTVFRVSTRGEETVLHSFGKGSDGAFPYASLIYVSGMLYGTTYFGGAHKAGTVFRISTSGTEQVLYSFKYKDSDGYNPAAGLVELDGTLYGTTLNGGTGGRNINNAGGTVFSVTTTGAETVLHSFKGNGPTGVPDGSAPQAGLIAVNGTLYGTTSIGGVTYTNGTIFSITTNGIETVLHSFARYGIIKDGTNPLASLIDVNGTLYGTTIHGGKYGGGTVFALTP